MLKELISYYWSAGWVNDNKIADITFDNYEDDMVGYFILYTKDILEDAKITRYNEYNWDEDADEWIIAEKSTFEYLANGYISTYWEWNDIDQVFDIVYKVKTTSFFEPNGDAGYKYEEWDFVYDEWEILYWYQTFSNHGVDGELLDETYKIWHSDSSRLVNQKKTVYTEWGEFLEDKVSVSTISGKSFYSMYPNPANHEVSIRFDETASGSKQVVIRDISGRVVYSTSSSNEIIELSVSELKTGIYFVEVSDGQKTVISKLLKN